MARGQRTDPARLAEAVSEGRRTGDWDAAAKAAGVSRSALYRERQRLDDLDVKPKRGGSRKRPKRKRSTKRPASQSQPAGGGGASQLEDASQLAAGDDPNWEAELRAVAETADFEQIDGLIDRLLDRFERLPDASPRVSSLANVLSSAIARRARLRPPPPPDPEELLIQRRRQDGEVRKMLLRHVEEYERQAARDGVCIHCGAPRSAAPVEPVAVSREGL